MAVVQGELWTGLAISASPGTANEALPISSYYYDGRIEYVIYASDLTALGFITNATITELRLWQEGRTAGSTIPGVRMALKHTTRTAQSPNTFTASGDQYSTFAEKWSGTLTVPAALTWVSFPFSTPFVWDGTSNIVIHFSKDTVNTFYDNNGTSQWRTTPVERMKRYTADNADTFPFDGAGTSTAALLPRTYLVGDDGVGSGGTAYTQSVGGASLTPSQQLRRSTAKRTGQASVTPIGVTGKGLSLRKTVGQGTVTPTGSLTQNITGLTVSAGGAILTPIGSLAKRTYKGVGGIVTSAGRAIKGLFKTVGGGSVASSGTVSGQLNPEPPPTLLRTAINWVKKGLKNFS